jgi:DNA repair protein RecO (recombination protein O)
MGLLKSEVIVLKTYPLNNSDKIVVAYSRQYGKVRGVAKGAQRPKSKFAGCFEPLNWVELVFFEKENRQLVSIDAADLLRSFSSRITDYGQFLKLLFVAELVFETTPDGERNEPLFRLLLLVLAEMEKGSRLDLALLYFEIWFLKLSGLFPSIKVCRSCGKSLRGSPEVGFDVELAGFFCQVCRGKRCYRISAYGYELLAMILTAKLEQIKDSAASSVSFKELFSGFEAFLKKSFERDFDSLKMIEEERALTN